MLSGVTNRQNAYRGLVFDLVDDFVFEPLRQCRSTFTIACWKQKGVFTDPIDRVVDFGNDPPANSRLEFFPECSMFGDFQMYASTNLKCVLHVA